MRVAQASVCVARVIVFVGMLPKEWMDVPPPPCGRSDLATGGLREIVSGCVDGTFVSCMHKISGE